MPADVGADRCPFEEHDCLRARELLNEAVKILDDLVQGQGGYLRAFDEKVVPFLAIPEIAALAKMHRTGKVPMPAEGHFVPRTEQVVEKMREYVDGSNVVQWFIGNLHIAASGSLRRGVALALMVAASAARSSKGQIRLFEFVDLAKWAFENAKQNATPEPPEPGAGS